MAGVRNSLSRTQYDASGQAVKLKSCHVVLEAVKMEKMSRYLKSCVGRSGQDEVPNGAADAESDSGDSLFITQKPVPEAERSGRRRTCRSKRAPPRILEESDEEGSSSAGDDEEYKTVNKRKRNIKKTKLPKYNFFFLEEQNLKFRSSLFPDQNKSLIHYTMGGFFKCVRELRLDLNTSLPTVDTDGEDLSPLSEEDEDRSEGEDIKVVERKRFVSLSKAKRRQTWSSPLEQQRKREASNAGQGTSQDRQTQTSHINTVKLSPLKDVPVSSVTQGSGDGESSCRALDQEERKDQHATSDENFLAQTGTPKTDRHHTHRDALHLQKASEEDSDSTVCEPRKLPQCQSPQKGGEASTPVTEPQTDVCNETEQKKKTDEQHHESVEEETSQSQEEPDNTLTQEEGDVPSSKQKKKKRKKDKSAAENVPQEVDRSLEPDVRVEDSNMEDCGKEKKMKKKKKRKRSGEDVEQVQSGLVVAPLNGDVEIQKKKKKKRKKEEMIVEDEEEETSDRILDLPPMSTERLEESGNCSENAAASQNMLDSGYVKRKKHKKNRQSSSKDASQDGEEGVDVSDCLDSVTSIKGMSLKQKKTTVSEWVNSSYAPEETEKVDYPHEENAELVTKKKKKKKKKGETFSGDVSEDKVAQSDDSVSVRKKKKERTSSFLVADAEENHAQAHEEEEKPSVSAGELEELKDGVMKKKKKKKKRKMSAVEEDPEQDFEEPKKSALPETTDTGVKKKKKQTGSESESFMERLEADVGFSPTDEAVVSKKKKKKKKKCEHEQEGPPPASEDVESVALNTCSSVSHEINDEHGHRAVRSPDSSKETLNMVECASASSETPGNEVLNGTRDKKKKKKKLKSTDAALLEGSSLMESAEFESREMKKKQRNKQSAVLSVVSETSVSQCETSSSENIMKNKHRKVKRRLHNASEDFLSDW